MKTSPVNTFSYWKYQHITSKNGLGARAGIYVQLLIKNELNMRLLLLHDFFGSASDRQLVLPVFTFL